MDYVTIGKNIRKYRRMRELRQEDLAEMCGCSNSHIGKIENANVVPSLEIIVRVANALSVTVDQLLWENYENQDRIYLKEIAERISRYPLKQRVCACESLIGFLDSLRSSANKQNRFCVFLLKIRRYNNRRLTKRTFYCHE